MNEKRLPDTPWHVGYAKKKDDDPRRHKRYCIHYYGGQCHAYRAESFGTICASSSHCSEYAITTKQYEKSLEERKTLQEIEQDNILKYKQSLQPRKIQIVKEGHIIQHQKIDSIDRCIICDDPLLPINRGESGIKKCKFCGMFYASEERAKKGIQGIVKNEPVLIVEKAEFTEKQFQHGIYISRNMNKKKK